MSLAIYATELLQQQTWVDDQQLFVFNWMYEHNWLDCESIQTRIEHFEGLFHWSTFIQHLIDKVFIFIGFKRDCSGLEKITSDADVDSSLPERPQKDLDELAFATFTQDMGQGNTFTLDSWSYIKPDPDIDDDCILYISGMYQRNVKVDHIELTRYDNETGNVLWQDDVDDIEAGKKDTEFEWTYTGKCKDMID